ncbi:MAG: M28 family peptidase [Armatimonadetes bacterium]|nr:M28 family peptidase [Armatimonadota bacterium]MDE2205239.1 M28 family peptidase [Armatimonadota bacterium]
MSVLLLAVVATLVGCGHGTADGAQVAGPTPAPAPTHPTFDSARAWTYLTAQTAFGPRPLGSPAHAKCLAWLQSEMSKYADVTIAQKFTYHQMPCTNVVGVFYPAGSTKPSQHPVLILAHWDTRPIADGPYSTVAKLSPPYSFSSNGWNRVNPILGADDGASAVGVVLELAKLFKQQRPPVGVVLLLDDGEDYGDFNANNGDGDGVELGSRYFAKNFSKDPRFGKPEWGILLDMIGMRNLFIPRESASQQFAGSLNDRVFGVAQSLGYGKVFRSDEMQDVGDDHLALNKAGIPTIDLIDPLPYPPYQNTGYIYWHTLEDTVDKCDAQSLKAVGDVVTSVVYSGD